MIDKEFLANLFEHPRENLSVEIKRWIDPDSEEGISKIVKASIAMRNNNGGFLIIGFDNSGNPVYENVPEDVRAKFHIDKIQGLVTKYASDSFEIEVAFHEKEGQEYPVVSVPSGVKTPVATKTQLSLPNIKKPLIPKNKVYVRSLNANNTPSTTEATWKDWDKLMGICFDNREADIGRFIRRHLIGSSSEKLLEIMEMLKKTTEDNKTVTEIAEEYLDESLARFVDLLKSRKNSLPKHGSWEVALVISGEIPEFPSKKHFLNLIASSNPNYTGWPVWVDSRQFANEDARPHIFNDAWEALIISLQRSWSDHIDYWRMHPQGHFYLRRALADDLSKNAPAPLSALDFGIKILRVAEAIAVGVSFARAMGCREDINNLFYLFRWNGLKNRILCSWAEPSRYLSADYKSYQNELTTAVTVPLDIPPSAIYQKVQEVINPLFELFDGFEIGIEITEELTNKLINRKL